MTPINRALSVLDAYCARNGVPADHEVVVHVREGIVARQDQGGGWRAILDDAMDEVGCSIAWDGDAIRDVTVWGEPARRPQRLKARDSYVIPLGHLDAQRAEEDAE